MLPSCSNVTLSNLQTYAHINETIHVLTCCVLPFQSISTIHTFTLNMFTVFFKQVLWYFSYILLHVDYNSCMLPTYEYFTFSAVHSFGSDSSFTHIEPRWQLLMLWMILCDHRTPIMFFFLVLFLFWSELSISFIVQFPFLEAFVETIMVWPAIKLFVSLALELVYHCNQISVTVMAWPYTFCK